MLHVYCGDGKGKTTAAIGLAVRAAGAGQHVHIIQLMKGRFTSELAVLNEISLISYARCDKDYGFYRSMTNLEKAEITDHHNRMLSEGIAMVESGAVQMLILDEFNSAYAYNLLDREMVDDFILHGNHQAEIVLTGRCPDEKFLEKADYVSEIKCVRHPYERGVTARKGIEY
ncbi:MAG: cob(I)yrinic acid a,c-diamide adenosyltransferase [Oscillospiraceae bacterium]